MSVSVAHPASTKGLTLHEADELLAILRDAIKTESEAHGYSSPVAAALRSTVPHLLVAAGLVAGREARPCHA